MPIFIDMDGVKLMKLFEIKTKVILPISFSFQTFHV